MKKISIIVAAYNAEKTILKCVLSLKKQKYPKFEIIVVDDGSTDNTKRILEETRGIKVIAQKNKGPGAARNKGAKNAKGDILVFIDSDCEVRNKYWLKKIVDVFNKDNRISAVTSDYIGSIGKKFIEEYAYLELNYRLKNISKYVLTAPANNISCRREIFEKVGGFPEEKQFISSEDVLFSYKISRIAKILWKKDIGIYHKFRSNLVGYLKQQEGFTKSSILLFLKYPRLLFTVSHHSRGVYAQIVFTFLLFLSLIVSFFNTKFFIISLSLFFAIAILNLKFLIFLKVKKGFKFMVKGFFVILARNTAYIVGLIKGFFKLLDL